MSNVQAAIKVADQLIARVLDQRQFTSGEIGYLVRELGENNKIEDDLNKVLKLNQDVCVISDRYTSDLFKIDDNVTKNTLDQVIITHDRALNLIGIESKFKKIEEDSLKDAREKRAKLRRDYSQEIASKLEKLNDTLVSEELEMERKYLLFEEKLRNKV